MSLAQVLCFNFAGATKTCYHLGKNDKEYKLTVQFCSEDKEILWKHGYCTVCDSMRVDLNEGKPLLFLSF